MLDTNYFYQKWNQKSSENQNRKNRIEKLFPIPSLFLCAEEKGQSIKNTAGKPAGRPRLIKKR